MISLTEKNKLKLIVMWKPGTGSSGLACFRFCLALPVGVEHFLNNFFYTRF